MAYVRHNWKNGQPPALNAQHLNEMEDGIAQAMCPYEVDDIYITTHNYTPAELSAKWPGTTWTRFAKGQVLVGVDENDADFDHAGKPGGRKDTVLKSHTHTMGHTHDLQNHTHTSSYGSNRILTYNYGTVQVGVQERVVNKGSDSYTAPVVHSGSTDWAGVDAVYSGGPSTNSTGNSSAGNTGGASGETSDVSNTNLQPYIACFIWKRTN